ncbi:uncharacterized protein [Argopecten irradians]|uniref:uncharacterized protein n=1 Tax=Argopecten irradians TaxID=31199 RepID=UPI0037108C4E
MATATNTAMHLGEEFETCEEFEEQLASICQNYTVHSKSTDCKMNVVKIRCVHSGSICVNVITTRELRHQQRTVTSQCQFRIKIMKHNENGKYVVVKANLVHDHDVCQEIFFHYPNMQYLHKNCYHYGLTKERLDELVEWLDTHELNHPPLQKLHMLLKIARGQTHAVK